MNHPAIRLAAVRRCCGRWVLRDRSLVVLRELRRGSPLVGPAQVVEAVLLCTVTLGGTAAAVALVVDQGTSLSDRSTARAAELATSGRLVPADTRAVRTPRTAGPGSLSRTVEVTWTFDAVPHRQVTTRLAAERWHPAEELEVRAGTELIWVDALGAPVRAPQSPAAARVTAWSTAGLGGLIVLGLTAGVRWVTGGLLAWCSALRWQHEVDDWRRGRGSPGHEVTRS